PSIVLPLRTAAKNTYVGRGYLNATVVNGDADFFKISINKTRTINFSLDMPIVGMNGKVSFYYSNGKRVASFDRYTFSDGEVGEITLKKGNYYIKVEEVNGISDFDQYYLTIRN
ncbi:pre-peptidase C-terminal domain-containing protein, partial [Bacillus velezensis]|uniref:pre-peptidase C-terminal domain-containing protein n=1 Tax=Bacillus velezensis TaxID=492670 RepID=UPI002FFFD631